MKKSIWEENAEFLVEDIDCFVDWEERYYICPNCGEPIYECDWEPRELELYMCPVCEW